MNRILIITEKESDLSRLIKNNCDSVTFIPPTVRNFDTNEYDAVAILGGNTEEGLCLTPPLRLCVEKMRAEGKPVFCEFLRSIGGLIEDGITRTTHHRLVYSSETGFSSLKNGDVLDGHYNDCIEYAFINKNQPPILVYHNYVCAHSNVEMAKEQFESGRFALFTIDKNTLVCAFRLCNFRIARLAPIIKWQGIISSIVSFLCGEAINLEFETPVCRYQDTIVTCAKDTDNAIKNALNWFKNAGILINEGRDGADEGFSHHIRAKDGVQLRRVNLRADCTGEVGGAFLFDSLLNNNEQHQVFSDFLFKFIFDYMQVKDGEHSGMIRWTEAGFETCYQDDVARAILPLLMRQHFDGKVDHLEEIKAALDYMLETTGEDGIRVPRTDICNLTKEKRERYKKAGVGRPSGHYNAYYHAALLLAYKVCKNERYLEVAQKGLSTLMSLYPNTTRETSETAEYCRLVFPLAVLYEITKSPKHREWLVRVATDLQKFKHDFGGYAEWDTGYNAKLFRNNSGECALLANNGDPVADLLYSNNWLPLGFAYAYLATGEKRFHELWCSIASFMLSCQIHSDDKLLNGAWSRAFDMENKEAHGVPHDVGWAPCCIESGWSVGEIVMGLQFMSVAEKHNTK